MQNVLPEVIPLWVLVNDQTGKPFTWDGHERVVYQVHSLFHTSEMKMLCFLAEVLSVM